MSLFFFYFFAIAMVCASLSVILSRNPLYNVLSLVVTIFCLSSLFITLEAFFVGVILLMVYAGAVLIFFLFVVMCLNLNDKAFTESQQGQFKILGWFAGIMFFCELLLVTKSFIMVQGLSPTPIRGTIENIGRVLFTDYLLPFELTSFLLLIAIFGIVSLAKGALSSGIEENKA